MKPSLIALALAAALTTSSVMAETDTEKRIAESQAAIKAFASQLKGELQAAMKSGGPINAINVCNKSAPAIAANISREMHLQISRTSLKTRNPANKPDVWEKDVLDSFEVRKEEGEPVDTIDFAEIDEIDGKPVFRYMKAIPTGEVCLKCHGTNIDPNVITKIESLYPDDQARGFKKGDIRGAFSVIQPM
jgi:hypothetical protein